jgi:hypothetical protein
VDFHIKSRTMSVSDNRLAVTQALVKSARSTSSDIYRHQALSAEIDSGYMVLLDRVHGVAYKKMARQST